MAWNSTMTREQPSLTIPLRSSSINSQSTDLLSPTSNHSEKAKASKASKILGTTDIPIQHTRETSREEKKRTRRPSFMRAPEIQTKKSGSFVPFPTAAPDAGLSSQQLRVRASSPLLGHDYQSHDTSPPPPSTKSSKKIHHAGSSSTLYSYFNHRNSTVTTDSKSENTGTETVDFAQGQKLDAEQKMRFKQPKGSMKESKRKMRPPRIDLSLLFPKPKPTAAPLLSPKRMMSSPSPISVVSEHPTALEKPDDRATTTTATVAQPAPKNLAPPTPKNRASSVFSEIKFRDWLDPSLERTVRTSEMDSALDKYTGTQQAAKSDASSIMRSRSREQLHSSHSSNSADRSVARTSSKRSEGGWSKDSSYLSPKTRPRQQSNRSANTVDTWQTNRLQSIPSEKSLVSKKSSKSTLKNSDLNNSSVLCLSSSEDEEDYEEQPATARLTVDNSSRRSSVATYGEFEPEICTASAAQATRGPALKRVDGTLIPPRSHPAQRHPSPHRMPSKSSTKRSSSAPRKSRRSSGIPTIAEPDAEGDWFFPQPPAPPSPRELNRRSRLMTVTRQEENLLEAMRLRKGKITPSIFQESRYNGNTNALDPERASMLSAPSRDSFYGGDTSFLRLSPGLPPYVQRADQGANHMDKDTTAQSSVSDAEQKTVNSSASNRGSLVYSESLPSPATSGASPLTPTLPIHRFSPLPQKPPPRHPPPAVPPMQRRHSRRRTDSSEAIVLGDAEESKETDEFPVWAYGWNGQRNSMTPVH